jgi:hypothetical protein
VVLEARKIIERLFSRGGQAASGGLLLDEQLALPEKIEKSPLFVRQTDAVLKARDPACKFVPERCCHCDYLRRVFFSAYGLSVIFFEILMGTPGKSNVWRRLLVRKRS